MNAKSNSGYAHNIYKLGWDFFAGGPNRSNFKFTGITVPCEDFEEETEQTFTRKQGRKAYRQYLREASAAQRKA